MYIVMIYTNESTLVRISVASTNYEGLPYYVPYTALVSPKLYERYIGVMVQEPNNNIAL